MLNDLIPLPQRLEGISIVGDRESPRNLSTSEIGESLNHDLPSANSTAIAAVQDIPDPTVNSRLDSDENNRLGENLPLDNQKLKVTQSDTPVVPPASEQLSKSAGTIVHIQTGDDQIIPASFALLTKYSTFISDLPHLEHNHSTDSDIILLPLPSATSGGMRLVLNLLETVGSTSESSSPWSELTIMDLQDILDAITIADAYSISSFQTILLDSAIKYLSKKPLLDWAIYVLASTRTDERQRPNILQDTLRAYLEILPSEIRAKIFIHVPYSVWALERYQRGWIKLVNRLRKKLSVLAKPHNGFNDYSRACRGTDSGRKLGCAAFRFTDNWVNLRFQASEAVLSRCAKAESELNDEVIRGAIDLVVTCPKCATRLLATFRPALCDFGRNAYRYGVFKFQKVQKARAEPVGGAGSDEEYECMPDEFEGNFRHSDYDSD